MGLGSLVHIVAERREQSGSGRGGGAGERLERGSRQHSTFQTTLQPDLHGSPQPPLAKPLGINYSTSVNDFLIG